MISSSNYRTETKILLSLHQQHVNIVTFLGKMIKGITMVKLTNLMITPVSLIHDNYAPLLCEISGALFLALVSGRQVGR